MRRFRKRLDKRVLIDAVQYSGTVKPEVPHKLLKKTWCLMVWFGSTKWRVLTRNGYLPLSNGDFVVRYSGGGYDVMSPKTFVKVYERV